MERYSPPGGQGMLLGPRVPNTKQEKEMNKLLSVIVAALFAVSTTAFVASPVGAQMKDEKKTEKKAEKKKGEPKKKGEGKKKSEGKKSEGKKSDGKKKDEMKK
jgi:hypothetical protein